MEARTEAEKMKNSALAEEYRIKQLAEADKKIKVELAEAKKAQFEAQLKAYKVMPDIFKLRAKLDFLKNDCKNVRKYVLSSELQGEVYELNLEEKERLNLFDADLSE